MKIKIFVFNALSLISDSFSKSLLPSQFWISEEHDWSCSSYKIFFGFSLFFQGEHKNPNLEHEQCTYLSHVQSLFSYFFSLSSLYFFFIIKHIKTHINNSQTNNILLTISLETKHNPTTYKPRKPNHVRTQKNPNLPTTCDLEKPNQHHQWT